LFARAGSTKSEKQAAKKMEEKGKSSLINFLYLQKNNQSNSEHNQTHNISAIFLYPPR